MKTFSVLCIALCVGVSTTAAFARGGMGGHGMGSSPMSMTGMSTTGMQATGGAFGTSAVAPGTNPAIDREDAKVEKMIGSICRGC
jgi:hypothetical protein